MWAKIDDAWEQMANYKPLDLKRLPPNTRLVVHPLSREEGDPFQDLPVEFVVLDPASLKVIVTDPKNFPSPTEGTFIGSCDHNDTPTEPGKIKHLDRIIYEVEGNQYRPQTDPVSKVEIFKAGQTTPVYTLWNN